MWERVCQMLQERRRLRVKALAQHWQPGRAPQVPEQLQVFLVWVLAPWGPEREQPRVKAPARHWQLEPE
jgi:hypothetical protein